MVPFLTHDTLRMLLAEHEPPCLSLYVPTHRRRPENQQDPVRKLCARAWTIVEPDFRARLRALVERFEDARSRGRGAHDLAQVALAAAASRVESLLVETERRIPGRLDPASGTLTLGPLEDPQVDDLLDDLAELVLSRGGQVVVVPAADMPTASGVAAIFRF